MSESPVLPIPIKTDIRFAYQRTEEIKTYDYKNFPPRTNKIETIGTIRKKKFLVECDGQGRLRFVELKNQVKIIEELSKLVKKGIITPEEFEQKKKELLDQF